MKHTATPWAYDEDSRWPHCLMGHEENPSNGWISRVAKIEYLSKADAEFIVCCCNAHEELLKELKGLAVYLQHLESHVPKAGATEQLNSCLKAITKAEVKSK